MIFDKTIKFLAAVSAMFIFNLSLFSNISAQSYMLDMKRDSARSDKLTGGKIEKAALVPGDGNLKITINVPAFQMTLWQSGKEVKTYQIGVGMKDYPIFIGRLSAGQVIWNPDWIPPDSDWVQGSKTVKVGEVIPASDKRNPVGKVKIPLGDGYLIHQAKGIGDLGNLVSHGCVRVMLPDLYDLSEKIVIARNADVTDQQIANAKATKNTVIARLDTPVPVEITYDTQVVEAGKLHVYPDVYDRKKNTVVNLRAELESNKIDTKNISDETLEKVLSQAVDKKQFVVSVAGLKSVNILKSGQILTVVGSKPIVSPVKKTAPVVKTRVSKKG